MSLSQVYRRVLVDDTDPSIEYASTGWVEEKGTRINVGTSGLPFNGTLHSSTASTNFTTRFSGSRVSVYGSIDVQFINGVQHPQWECIVDDVFTFRATVDPKQGMKTNNFELCAGDTFFAGAHKLVVRVTAHKAFFSFDYLLYTPFPDTDLSDKVIRIDDADEAVKNLSKDIPIFVSDTTLVYTNGSSLSIEFVGKSLAWYGCTLSLLYPPWLGWNSGSAMYSIDGQANQTFRLDGATSGKNFTNQLLFTTPDLYSGKHELVVTYVGDGMLQVPLCLDYVIVTRNGTTEVTTSNSPSSTGPQDSQNSRTSEVFVEEKKSRVGPMVGGIVGGLLAISLVAIFCTLWWLRKRRHRSKIELDLLSDIVDDATDSPTPQLTPFFSMKDSQNNILGSPLTSHNSSRNSDSPASSSSNSQTGASQPALRRASSGFDDDESEMNGLPRPRRLLHHRDSGIRISMPVEEQVVEVPPTYTPS